MLNRQTYFKRHYLQINLKLKKKYPTNKPTKKPPNKHTAQVITSVLPFPFAQQFRLFSSLSHKAAQLSACLLGSPLCLPLSISLPGGIQSIHIFLGCLHPKDKKTSICSRLPATGVFISLFVSALKKRGKNMPFCNENFLC